MQGASVHVVLLGARVYLVQRGVTGVYGALTVAASVAGLWSL